MLILIRKIRMRGGQVIDRRDSEIDAKTLQVGSGEDQELQLFGATVAPAHAVIKPRADGELRIECRKGQRVHLGDKDHSRVSLNPGEWATLGPHRITAVPAPPGFDAAIEVRIDTEAVPAIKDRLRDDLAPKLPGLRRYSYGLAILVALIGLALPMLRFFQPDTVRVVEKFTGPVDQVWSTGPLAEAHHLPGIADNCNVCHVKPFERVKNETCLECHDKTTVHFTAGHPITGDFDNRCLACHKEHNEPSRLIVKNKALCTDCHSNTQERRVADSPAVDGTPVASAPKKLPKISAFSQTGHPDFLVSLLRNTDKGWRVQRLRLGSEQARESSGLKFPHDLHLGKKVSLADGPSSIDRKLVCTDCHLLSRAGEHFEPLSMETTCAGCHSLAFDDVQPDRQLPHGDTARLRTYLEEYYVSQAARGQLNTAPSANRRILPHAEHTAARRCTGGTLKCGTQRANEEMDKLFTKAGCVSCHEVYREDDEWQVRPVRLVEDWYSAARFDHRPHLNPGANLSDSSETCVNCHAAEKSEHSEDVLMPGLKNCMQCHNEARASAVALQCVDCHDFHRTGLPVMAGPAHE